jgi:hypothetical protein
MWTRGVAGVVVCLVGAIWIAQGTGAWHGSAMSGHGHYAVLGAAAVVIGLGLIMWANQVRRRRPGRTP